MEEILNIENLNIFINNKILLKDVNLKVHSGEVVVALGGNGTGKSSLVNAILGNYDGDFENEKNEVLKNFDDSDVSFEKNGKLNINKKSCKISFCGKQIVDKQLFRRQISCVEQNDNLQEETAMEEVLRSALISDDSLNKKQLKVEVKNLFKQFNLEKILNKKICNLSGGQKRMVNILSALIRKNSKLYIFDEPINSLDSKHAVLLSNYITELKKQNKAVLIITHCKMFPNISKAYEIKNHMLKETEYQYYTCFGVAENEIYKV